MAEADAQLLTVQSCARGVSSAAGLAAGGDVDGAQLALERAEHCLRRLGTELPPHSRRARLARTAVEKARKAVQAARKDVGLVELTRATGAAYRAAEAALAP